MKKFILKPVFNLILSEERKRIYPLLALMLVGMLLETISIGLIIPLISLLSNANTTVQPALIKLITIYLNKPTAEHLVLIALFGMVFLYIIKAIFLIFLSWRLNSFVFDVQNSLSQRLYSLYMRQPYSFHLYKNSGALIANVTTEVTVFTFNIMLPLMVLSTEVLIVIGMILLIFYIEPLGSIVVISVFTIVSVIFQRLTNPKIKKCGSKRQFHESMRLQHLQQGFGGVKEIKLLAKEDSFLKQYEFHNFSASRVGKVHQTLMQLPRLWIELLAVICMTILVFFMLTQGKNLISILPVLGLFAGSAFRLMPSLNRILNALQQIKYATPVIELLNGELNNLKISNDYRKAETRFSFRNKFQLCNIDFTYPKASKKAVDNISISINCGEQIGFIGESGSGKSTIVDIILGLLPVDNGKIIVDNIDITYNMRSWQDQIGYVPQVIFLIDDSIKKNIAFGVDENEIDEDAIKMAIKAAQLDDFILSLPEGLNTSVGERGVRLSGGQRQRIGIARALYNNPKVLLLDEATSALDSETEAEVMESINSLHGEKTIIIVAHRISTLSSCDKIFRIDKGKIGFEGTFKQIQSHF